MYIVAKENLFFVFTYNEYESLILVFIYGYNQGLISKILGVWTHPPSHKFIYFVLTNCLCIFTQICTVKETSNSQLSMAN